MQWHVSSSSTFLLWITIFTSSTIFAESFVVISIIRHGDRLLFSKNVCFSNNNDDAEVSNTKYVLAKTKESFKLSDLYLLETKLESQARNLSQPQLIGIDANTGSYLLQLDKDILKNNNVFEHNIRPSCLDRYDWITNNLVASGFNGQDLIQDLTTKSLSTIEDDFTLDYICMERLKNHKDYSSSKNLMCRVAQCIPTSIALSPNRKTSKKLMLIETSAKLYLAILDSQILKQSKSHVAVHQKWSKRPYQYSSAMNPIIAKIVVDLLNDLTTRSIRMENKSTIKMLDPTCGSGTFLAFALEKGMDVWGNDINDKCVAGSIRNLRYVFDDDDDDTMLAKKTKLTVGDFSSSDSSDDYFDCAITNLPWGQNTEIRNKTDNLKILKGVYRKLRQGAYCAIISKSNNITNELASIGFRLIGKASVPPTNFVLPTSKKGKQKPRQTNLETSNCFLSIVIKDV